MTMIDHCNVGILLFGFLPTAWPSSLWHPLPFYREAALLASVGGERLWPRSLEMRRRILSACSRGIRLGLCIRPEDWNDAQQLGAGDAGSPISVFPESADRRA